MLDALPADRIDDPVVLPTQFAAPAPTSDLTGAIALLIALLDDVVSCLRSSAERPRALAWLNPTLDGHTSTDFTFAWVCCQLGVADLDAVRRWLHSEAARGPRLAKRRVDFRSIRGYVRDLRRAA